MLKTPLDKYHATVLLGVAELLGATLCILLVRFTGKRPLVFISLIACAFCFSSTAFYARHYDIASTSSKAMFTPNSNIFEANGDVIDLINGFELKAAEEFDVNIEQNKQIVNEEEISADNDRRRFTWLPLVLLLAAALVIHMGIGLVPWMLIGEMYPANVRSGSSSLSIGFGYLYAFFANKLFLWMLELFTLPGLFYIYSIIAVVGCISFYFVLPETEGRSLLEIEAHFARRDTQLIARSHS